MRDDERIEAIRQREQAAMPGPWLAPYIAHAAVGIEDAEFVAHAREDVPWLLSQLSALQQERDALRAALIGVSHAGGQCWCDHGIGNPMMRDHSAACTAARFAVAQD